MTCFQYTFDLLSCTISIVLTQLQCLLIRARSDSGRNESHGCTLLLCRYYFQYDPADSM